VTSLPTGAQVYLDNSFNGQTPLNLKIPLGKYEVRLSLPDYYEWEAQLQLNKAGETPLFVRLIPMD
jgi:eukaryotic-like serine/threonine-protein kinase